MMWLNKCFDFNYWIKFNEKRKCLMKTADFCLYIMDTVFSNSNYFVFRYRGVSQK